VFNRNLGADLGQPEVRFDGELVEQAGFQQELLERDGPAVPVRAIRLGRDCGDELLAKRFPVTVEAGLDNCGRQPEYPRLPGRLENEFAVAPRRSSNAVDVE
jgi:hypothetical protein